MTKQDIKKLFGYFLESSSRDFATYKSLLKAKRYDAALFFLHLTIEKKIKALFIKQNGRHPPLSHDLVFLIGRCDIDVSDSTLSILRVISTFNIESRYENEKFDFHKIATREYTATWGKKGLEVSAWIEQQLDQV